jgi:hypothetical protein
MNICMSAMRFCYIARSTRNILLATKRVSQRKTTITLHYHIAHSTPELVPTQTLYFALSLLPRLHNLQRSLHNEQVRFCFIAVKLLLLRPASILQLVSDCIRLSTFRRLCKKVSLATVMCPTAVYSWGLAIYHR